MPQGNDQRIAVSYILGGHRRSDSEIHDCRTGIETRAREEKLVIYYEIVEHDTSRRPRFSETFFPRQGRSNGPKTITAVIVPTIADLGATKSRQKKRREHLERLGIDILTSDKE